MMIKVIGADRRFGTNLSILCPHCGQHGTFEPLPEIADVRVKDGHTVGQRKCPNPRCNGHLFCILDDLHVILRTYPPLRIDFDPTDIPDRIRKTLSEAITCHAEECYVAAAIMVRRCLEELCDDRGAQGDNLKKRVAALQTMVILPKELFQAMDKLRLLGNDAAHIDAKLFNSIGKPEIDVALELTKEILRSIYQLDRLVKRLQTLKT